MKAASPRRGKKSQVGIREMRQNVTPLPTPDSILDRLVAEGRASAPTGDLLGLRPPGGKASRTLSEALQSVREDRA